jgi:hypothetical protein
MNEPPVVETKDYDETRALCRQIIAEAKKFEKPATDEMQAWKDRKSWAQDGATTIDVIAAREDMREQHILCVYKPLGRPVGLMAWRKSRHNGLISILVTLPGHESEGAILVEYGVNLSEKAKFEGRVYVPEVGIPGGFYRPPWHDCFHSNNVIPREINEWTMIDGKWRLTRYLPWRQLTAGREIFGNFHPQPYRL